MTSNRQADANRRNAKRSTGPKTEGGKAIARLNAVKHAVLATTPVVPKIERADEWEAHCGATINSLAPEGYLENLLAQRIALLLWRMGRIARYERESIALEQETVEDDLSESLRWKQGPSGKTRIAEVRSELDYAREAESRLTRTLDMDDSAPLSGPDANIILEAIAEQTEDVDFAELSLAEVAPDEVYWADYDGWTVGKVRRAVEIIAEAEGTTADRLWQRMLVPVFTRAKAIEKELADLIVKRDQMTRERLLPKAPRLDTITRYETHLSRQLSQSLQQLQRLQVARRTNEEVPQSSPADADEALQDV